MGFRLMQFWKPFMERKRHGWFRSNFCNPCVWASIPDGDRFFLLRIMKIKKLQNRMPRLLSCFVALLALVGTNGFASAAPWPPKLDGIESDPAVVYGTLENGVRWAYLPNAHPEEQLSLRLMVEAGSFMEEDEELGIAHFLEHMAFNGTRSFPAEGQAIETFQRHGLIFGQHLNAMTAFLRTLYVLELPHLEAVLLDDAFRFLEDQACGQVFDDAEIEKERGVILEEMRTRNSPHYRAYFSNMGFLLGEGRFAKRSPMGTEERVKAFQKEDFERFYRKWYTADRLIVVGVGALSSSDFEARVKAHFSGIAANAAPLPNPTDTILPPSATAVHFTDAPNDDHMLVQLASLVPAGEAEMSAERLREQNLEFMATAFLAIHCNLQVAGGKAPFLQAVPNVQEEPGLFRLNQLILVTQPSLAMETLQSLSRSLGELTREGFEPEQAERLKSMLLANLDAQVQQAATRQNGQLAQAMVDAFASRGAVFQHPSQEYALLKQWMQGWDGKQIALSLKNALQPERVAVLIQGKLSEAALEKEAVLSAYQEGLHAREEGKKNKVKLEWAYQDFGQAGEVVWQEFDPELKITRVRFANGVRVNLRELSTQQNVIHLNLRVGNGLAGIPAQDRRLAIAAPLHLQFGGFGKHALDEVQKLMMGKQFGIGMVQVGSHALEINAGGLRGDFPMLLEVLSAYLSDPGFRGSSHGLYQQVMQAQWKDSPSNPSEVFEMKVKPFIFGNDWRVRHDSKAEMLGASVMDSAAWLKGQLREGYLEVGFAGDFKTDKLLPEIARTLGALPPRSAEAPQPEAADCMHLKQGGRQLFRYKGPDAKAALFLCLPVCGGVDWKKATHMEVLTSVLQDALNRQIRESMGGSYGVGCRSECSWECADGGQLYVQMECDPMRIVEFEQEALRVMAEIAEKGVSADQFKRALKPLISQQKEYQRDPGHWLGWVLSRSQGTPWFNERMKGRQAVLESTTVEDLNRLAQEYFKAEKAVVAQVMPE
jgi:zinc protease